MSMISVGLVIKKSKFIAYKYEINSLQEVNEILQKLKKEHKKANHICYAYIYNKEIVSEKCSDDGEPNRTAGYPILQVMKKKNLTMIVDKTNTVHFLAEKEGFEPSRRLLDLTLIFLFC